LHPAALTGPDGSRTLEARPLRLDALRDNACTLQVTWLPQLSTREISALSSGII
jgi:hypothetical protein